MRKLLKTIFSSNRKDAYLNLLRNKYYNIWMNKYVIPELDYQMNDYIFRKFYSDGMIAGFIIKGTKGSELAPNGEPCFCPFAVSEINLYDFPIYVNLVNTRGVKFIPAIRQKVDEDVVLGWCQRNKKPVKLTIDYYTERMAIVEDVIRCNLNSHRVPWLLATNPEDEAAISEVFDNIMQGDSAAYIPSDFTEKIKILTSGNQFIIDKLYDYKNALEDELREYLGCDNLGVKNKKEHLISMEVEANDDVTEESGDIFFDEIQAFCERFTDCFGYKIHVEDKHPKDDPKFEDEEDIDEESDKDNL